MVKMVKQKENMSKNVIYQAYMEMLKALERTGELLVDEPSFKETRNCCWTNEHRILLKISNYLIELDFFGKDFISAFPDVR